MVLPDILASSYGRYKEDTNLFATWLTKAAQATRYETAKTQPAAPVMTSPKSKGRARMLAKKAATESGKVNGAPSPKATTPEQPRPAARYMVGTVKIIRQAEAVAASTKYFQLPTPILQAVERAIPARERCTRYFRTGTQAAKDRASDEKHDRFTEVLRKAREYESAGQNGS
ncbi:uncharacterized protein MYCFIDRAFT_176941 [Pseudocercospora fijiensis CIRAD86]|uniref:DUF6604 domain-containing protein n=1 Tax=Pseudocercospora fijiensis (strain CIRAD86) TaxID=383855 RepID=M3AS34_PSEFD|nr:uncharacterized protein MYCFIDRAFT_176941 [Pseudocercospora fijiensis CIRAD86]EME79943.1 hypothetical protein MYCFIDRAFT_176941 [Pseudocercospora fijiensis CIRAD86]